MPKMKTNKAGAKRFKTSQSSKNKTVMHRSCGQDHCQWNKSGSYTRAIRKDSSLHKSNRRLVRSIMPGAQV